MNKIFSAIFIIILACVHIFAHAKDFQGGNFQLKAALDSPQNYCLDIFGFGTGAETREPLSVHTCKIEGWRDATFVVDYPEQGQIYAPAYDMCAEVTRFERGAHLMLQTCSESKLQRFIYRENQTIELLAGKGPFKFCLVVHPAKGIPTGGPTHIRREVYVYDCDRTDLKFSQWLLPENVAGLAAPEQKPKLDDGKPKNPKMAAAAGFYAGACARCHGYKAEGEEVLQAPKLAGLSQWYLSRQLYNFVNGVRGANKNERWANQMYDHVSNMSFLTQELVVGVNTHLQTFDDAPTPITIEGDTAHGEKLYEQACASCHGADGLGNEKLNSPRLTGINDWYLLKQMQKFRDGRRGAHPDDEYGAAMVAPAESLPNEQALYDVIDYINSLSKK